MSQVVLCGPPPGPSTCRTLSLENDPVDREPGRRDAQVNDQDAIRGAWSDLTGRPTDERFRLVPPVHSDHGVDLRLGANVFINHGCTLNDIGGIDIGADTMIGPNVTLLTSGHPVAVVTRDVPPATLVAGNPARVLRSVG
ncbi:hypothetical protein AB0L40_05355 [Patulibacter sp. NPDC049589]|uniref:hypothetical protein n=1 Tax=Patulibacter sp. NPDC049589 TaxID=3154731 RepID=UPI00342C19B0